MILTHHDLRPPARTFPQINKHNRIRNSISITKVVNDCIVIPTLWDADNNTWSCQDIVAGWMLVDYYKCFENSPEWWRLQSQRPERFQLYLCANIWEARGNIWASDICQISLVNSKLLRYLQLTRNLQIFKTMKIFENDKAWFLLTYHKIVVDRTKTLSHHLHQYHHSISAQRMINICQILDIKLESCCLTVCLYKLYILLIGDKREKTLMISLGGAGRCDGVITGGMCRVNPCPSLSIYICTTFPGQICNELCEAGDRVAERPTVCLAEWIGGVSRYNYVCHAGHKNSDDDAGTRV